LGLLISLIVVEASCPERLGGAAVLMEAPEEERMSLVRLWVDQGFTGENFARVVRQLAQAQVEVIYRHSKEFEILPKRWIVERTLGWWNRYRRLSKDYEYLVEMSESMIYGAMIHTMLRRLAKLQQHTS
jgi:putative transposase